DAVVTHPSHLQPDDAPPARLERADHRAARHLALHVVPRLPAHHRPDGRVVDLVSELVCDFQHPPRPGLPAPRVTPPDRGSGAAGVAAPRLRCEARKPRSESVGALVTTYPDVAAAIATGTPVEGSGSASWKREITRRAAPYPLAREEAVWISKRCTNGTQAP